MKSKMLIFLSFLVYIGLTSTHYCLHSQGQNTQEEVLKHIDAFFKNLQNNGIIQLRCGATTPLKTEQIGHYSAPFYTGAPGSAKICQIHLAPLMRIQQINVPAAGDEEILKKEQKKEALKLINDFFYSLQEKGIVVLVCSSVKEPAESTLIAQYSNPGQSGQLGSARECKVFLVPGARIAKDNLIKNKSSANVLSSIHDFITTKLNNSVDVYAGGTRQPLDQELIITYETANNQSKPMAGSGKKVYVKKGVDKNSILNDFDAFVKTLQDINIYSSSEKRLNQKPLVIYTNPYYNNKPGSAKQFFIYEQE